MSWQRTAMEAAMLVGLVFYPLFDLVVAWTPNATFSEITIHALYRFPAVAFALGGVMGHLCWPVAVTRPHWITIMLVVATLLTVAALSFFRTLPPTLPIVGLVLGIVYGHIVWPQRVETATGASLQQRLFPEHIESRTQSADFRSP